MTRAPYAPLVPGGEKLAEAPQKPSALRRRMSAVYGVDGSCLLPVCGAEHGIALASRGVDSDGVRLIASPGERASLDLTEAQRLASGSRMLIIDESFIEFSEQVSLAQFACAAKNVAVVRSLCFAYGLAGAPCGAVIANPALISALEAAMEPWALSTPTIDLALAALDASRLPLTQEHWRSVRAERARVAGLLGASEGAGPWIFLRPVDLGSALAAIAAFDLEVEQNNNGELRIAVGAPAYNARVIAAFGIGGAPRPPRRAELVRDTKETRIAAAIDLDRQGPASIDTGIGFFDHMLSQVALHASISLTLTCSGDLHIDAHHTIEDCAIVLGQALEKALGPRRGIGRFGFLLPMDETEAQVSIDLGGRPFAVFSGVFTAPLLGAYPTEMTEHVFRSLAENMRAAIHISVRGDNDHHKTEACFKAFGRALRAAIRIEGDALPSTKGAI